MIEVLHLFESNLIIKMNVKVRCNTEYGDFELEDGTTVILSKDSTVCLTSILI